MALLIVVPVSVVDQPMTHEPNPNPNLNPSRVPKALSMDELQGLHDELHVASGSLSIGATLITTTPPPSQPPKSEPEP